MHLVCTCTLLWCQLGEPHANINTLYNIYYGSISVCFTMHVPGTCNTCNYFYIMYIPATKMATQAMNCTSKFIDEIILFAHAEINSTCLFRCNFVSFCSNRCISDHSDSDSLISHPVTCVDAVTVHLRSQCSGGCSDVQETAEIQS